MKHLEKARVRMKTKTSFLKVSIRLEKAVFKTMMSRIITASYKRKKIRAIRIAFKFNRTVSN